PAITYLEQGMSHSLYQSDTKALLQHYEGDEDKALATLEQSKDLPVLFYRHHVLRGDIYLAKTQKADVTGDDPQVQSHAEQALQHYKKAALSGRSDLQVQLKPLDVYLLLLSNSLYSKQRGFINLYQQAMAVLDNAIAISPRHYQAYFNKGELLSKMSYHESQHSGKPLDTRQQSIEQYQYALSLAPTNVDIALSLGTAYVHKIKLSQERDLPVEHLFTLAMNQFEKIPEQNRDYSYYSKYADLMLKSALHHAGQHASQADDNQVIEYFGNAVAYYHQSIALQPDKISGYINLGSVFRRWSMIVDLPQARQKLQQAIEQYQNAHSRNPNHFVVNFYLTQSYGFLADVNTLTLQSPESQLKQGMSYVKAAQISQPDHPYVVLESVNLAIIKAVFDWQNGNLNPDTLAQAKTNITNSLIINPNNITVLDGRAYLYRVEQQLAYFSAGAKIANQQEHQKALSVSKNILSQKHEETILLSLLSGQHQLFTNEDLNALPVGDHSRLAHAEWLSQSGDFEQAEKIFASIQRIYPAILWQYRQQHLSRWVEALEAAPSASTAAKVAYINRSASNLATLLGQHFPELVY
ncbi:MAG: hypothetical protein MJK04_03070, partial [Psychrosphaera sp.]|nr:hypothetical protein [Psychrosphaera sp.]